MKRKSVNKNGTSAGIHVTLGQLFNCAVATNGGLSAFQCLRKQTMPAAYMFQLLELTPAIASKLEVFQTTMNELSKRLAKEPEKLSSEAEVLLAQEAVLPGAKFKREAVMMRTDLEPRELMNADKLETLLWLFE